MWGPQLGLNHSSHPPIKQRTVHSSPAVTFPSNNILRLPSSHPPTKQSKAPQQSPSHKRITVHGSPKHYIQTHKGLQGFKELGLITSHIPIRGKASDGTVRAIAA
jgi:hypothetical protein